MTHLDNKKYLESILQGGDDDDDLGKGDYDLDNIDIDMILNEVDDFHIPKDSLSILPKKEEKFVHSPTDQTQSSILESKKNEFKKEERKIAYEHEQVRHCFIKKLHIIKEYEKNCS